MPTTPAPAESLSLVVCLHVTNAAALASIQEQGLIPQIGPLSEQLEAHPGIFLFPSWADLQNANWLFDEAWPHASEPALLCVDVRGLRLDMEAGYEVVVRDTIAAARVTVLVPDELDWTAAAERFYALGGRRESLSSKEVAAHLRLCGERL